MTLCETRYTHPDNSISSIHFRIVRRQSIYRKYLRGERHKQMFFKLIYEQYLLFPKKKKSVTDDYGTRENT